MYQLKIPYLKLAVRDDRNYKGHMKNIQPGQIWQHFKGGRYQIIAVAKHSETLEDLVIYEALYDNITSKCWARPLNDFFGTKNIGGKDVPRFQLVKE